MLGPEFSGDLSTLHETDTERPIIFQYDVGLIFGGDPIRTEVRELSPDVDQAVAQANKIVLGIDSVSSHLLVINDKVELPDGAVISLDELRAMAAPIEEEEPGEIEA
jgi:hypothetical protein